MEVYIHAKNLKKQIRQIESSDFWKSLIESGHIEKIKNSKIFLPWATQKKHIQDELSMKLSRENILTGLGNDAGLALSWNSKSSRPEWLLLSRTPLALAIPAWLASGNISSEHTDHSGTQIHTLKIGKKIFYVSVLGDLILSSNREACLKSSIDLVVGKTKASLGKELKRSGVFRKESSRAHLGLLINFPEISHNESRISQPYRPEGPYLLTGIKKRLRTLGTPSDLLALISVFLSDKIEFLEKITFLKATMTSHELWNGKAVIALKEPITPNRSSSKESITPLIPYDTAYCSLENINFRNWFNELLADESKDRAHINSEIIGYSKFLGIHNFDAEFLDLFGPSVAWVLSPQESSGADGLYPLPIVSTVFQIRSPETIRDFLKKSMAKLMIDMKTRHEMDQSRAGIEDGKPFPFEIQEIKTDGEVYSKIIMRENYLGSGLSPAYGIVGNALIISTSHRFFEKIYQIKHGLEPSLSSSKAFEAALKKLDAPYNGFWYISAPQLAKALVPIASTYVEGHKQWSSKEKEKHLRRIRYLESFAKIFDALDFTSRHKNRAIHLTWLARLKKS